MTERTIADISREIDEAVSQTRSDVAKLLPVYASSRDAEGVYRKDKERMGETIKRFLQLNEGELVEEGPDGTYVARLDERRVPGRTCDFPALFKNNPRLLEQLVHQGCLRLDMEAVKKAGALVGGIDQFLGPQGVTQYLTVEKVHE